MPRVVKRPQAIRDLASIVDYLRKERPEAALKFLDAAEWTFAELAAMPRIGATRHFRHPRLASVRIWPVPKFRKILIFYRPLRGGIEVIRVLHSARDIPGIIDPETSRGD